MRTMVTTALAALVFFCAGAAVKADFDPIDCSSTAFAFADAAYNVDCERSKDPVRAGESSGSSVTDVMTVSSDERDGRIHWSSGELESWIVAQGELARIIERTGSYMGITVPCPNLNLT